MSLIFPKLSYDLTFWARFPSQLQKCTFNFGQGPAACNMTLVQIGDLNIVSATDKYIVLNVCVGHL